MRSVPLVVLFLSSATACGGSGDAVSSLTVRDSAGVRIVENATPVWDSASAWRVAATPALSIGLDEGPRELQLHRVRSAVRLPDGRIAVANAGTHEIRIFDPSGRFLSAMGREGDGPGEFRGLERLWAGRGDSLVAFDAILKRFTVLHPDGGIAATYSLPAVSGRAESTLLAGRFADGSVLVKAASPLSPGAVEEGVIAKAAVFARALPGEAAARLLRELPDGRAYVLRDGEGATELDLPFGPQPQTAVGGETFFHSSGERFDIHQFGADGALRAIFRVQADPPPVTEEEKRSFRETLLDGVTGPHRTRLERYLDRVPFPARKPPHGRMIVDADGNLWVLRPQTGDGPFLWAVLAPDGRWLGTVSVPPRFRVFDVGRDHVLGVVTTADTNVEQVALHRIEKPRN